MEVPQRRGRVNYLVFYFSLPREKMGWNGKGIGYLQRKREKWRGLDDELRWSGQHVSSGGFFRSSAAGLANSSTWRGSPAWHHYGGRNSSKKPNIGIVAARPRNRRGILKQHFFIHHLSLLQQKNQFYGIQQRCFELHQQYGASFSFTFLSNHCLITTGGK